jgi:hypothetical protein
MSQKTKEAIHITARFFGRQLDDDVLLMMAETLSDLPEEIVVDAYRSYLKNPKSKTFPLPAQIRDIIFPETDPESAAREVAARINHAIVKFGWSNAELAKEYIGKVGWGLVEKSGGWSYACQNHGVILDPGVFAAQLRERAKSELKNESETINTMIGVNQSEKTKLIENTKKVTGLVENILNKNHL